MTETTIAAARDIAAVWLREAEARRRVSRHDAVADALEYCAAELIEHLRVVDGLNAVRTVDQFAADHGVTPQSVRGWIRRGELQATKTAHGWKIPRLAQRTRTPRGQAQVEGKAT